MAKGGFSRTKQRGDILPLKTGGAMDWPIKDVILYESQVLPDTPMVKRAGVDLLNQLTPQHIMELQRCMSDPIYFVKTYCRILTMDHGVQPFALFDYQEEMIRMYVENRYSIACTARQMGKCVDGDTKIKLRRNKGEPIEVSIEHFHEWAVFCEWATQHGITLEGFSE